MQSHKEYGGVERESSEAWACWPESHRMPKSVSDAIRSRSTCAVQSGRQIHETTKRNESLAEPVTWRFLIDLNRLGLNRTALHVAQ